MKRELKEDFWEDEINLDPELFCACRGESARIPKPVSTGVENGTRFFQY